MAPMAMGEAFYIPEETWSKRVMRYFEERAAGGLGLLNTGFVRVTGGLASQPIIGMYSDRFIPSHAELVKRVHRHNAKIFIQLGLQGGKWGSEVPSTIYSPNYPIKTRELTTGEMDGLIESFLDAAGRSIEAGYDGIEVHGGHTYFIGATMSPATNIRTDKYGGSFEGRMKFAADIIKGIKEKYPAVPVGFKFSAYEELPGGIGIELGQKIARYIADCGIAYLHVSSTASTLGIYSDYASVPPLYIPRNTLIPLAEKIKKTCPDQVIMAAGSITVPEEADSFIAEGKCDMVALGRTILADPHWVRRTQSSKPAVPCIRCHVCYHQLAVGGELACSLNPYLLHEAEQDLPVPARKKRVLVAGAGPAGVRCALTASKRGHDVTLYEKQPYVGGMLYPGSMPDCKQDVARAVDWMRKELEQSNVVLKLNTAVTTELVENEAPDALVIALGAEPVIPDVEGTDLPHTCTAVDVLRDLAQFPGKTAAVIGGGDVGCETACYMADNGFDVTIVEVLPEILSDALLPELRSHMLRLLGQKKVKIMTGTKLSRIIEGGIEVILPDSKQSGIEADLAVFALNLEINHAFVKRLSMTAEEVYCIGDAYSLGRIRDAVDAGERAGRRL